MSEMRNKPCPKCRELGHDKSGDHLWLMRDNETYCCNKEWHPVYYEGKESEWVHVPSAMQEIESLASHENRGRSVRKESLERFGTLMEFSEVDRSHTATYYPLYSHGILVGYKQRKIPKGFSIISEQSLKGVPLDLFGSQYASGGKKLLITGGEEDAIAAYEMLKDAYPKFEPAVVSLPTGENTYYFTHWASFLEGFEEVLICTDMDQAGRKAAEDIARAIGERSRIVTLDEKDASDMKVKNKESSFINAFFRAKEYRPSSIVGMEDIVEEVVAPVPFGLSYPWSSLTHMTYGLKKEGEIISLASAPGGGKSTFIRSLQKHIIFEHKEQIAVFDIEESAKSAGKLLVGAVMNKPIHLPDCMYDVEEARRAAKSVYGRVSFFDGFPEWDEVKSNIRYFAAKGIRFIFIDPLSALVAHLNAADGNTMLGLIMKDIMKMRRELGLTFFISNHLNNPQSGKSHEEGGHVQGGQFSGSRAQYKFSTALWGLERNQQAEEEEKDQVTLRIIKDRLGGKTGTIQLRYNKETGSLEEPFTQFGS